MQIEKHIKIISTSTGATVFFAGQVCLTVNEQYGRYTWSISPVFARLTTGISNCFEVPMSDFFGQETLAEAIADGLTRLDEMKAFYGVIDMPEDTYVGEHLDESYEEVDEGYAMDDIAVGGTVIYKTSKGDHRLSKVWYKGKGFTLHLQDGSTIQSHAVKSTDQSDWNKFKNLKEEVDEGADYSGIHADVKRTGKTHEQLAAEHRTYAKQMRVIGKDGLVVRSEMLANDHDKYVASLKKTNEDTVLAESFVVRQVGQSRNYPSRVMVSAEAVIKRAREMAKEAGSKSYGDYIKHAHNEIASIMKAESEEFEGDQIEEGSVSKEKQKTPYRNINSPEYKLAAQKQKTQMSKSAAQEPGKTLLAKIKRKEFIQYEDALPEVFQLIKEDCRAEAMTMTDSLLEAHQLANELFENIVEEYLNELSNSLLASYKRKAGEYASAADKAANISFKAGELDLGKRWTKRADKKFSGIMKATNKQFANDAKNEEVEDLDEAALSGDAYWKAKEDESKQEFLKAQRKSLGLSEPVKRGRGKPTLIDRDSLKTRAHSNIEAGLRPTAGFDRNEKIHFVRHLKNHPDFVNKHVSQAGRPTGTTNAAKQQKELVKKKQDTAFSMWAGLGKR